MANRSIATEVEPVVEELVGSYHTYLAGVPIVCIFIDVAPKSKGKRVLARIRKADDVLHLLTGYRLVLEVAEDFWYEANESQRLAVIDHELTHVMMDADNQLKIRAHDLEEFASVVRRHGLYKEDIELFFEKSKPKEEVTAEGG